MLHCYFCIICMCQIGWNDFRLKPHEEEDLSQRILQRCEILPAVTAIWLRPMVKIIRRDAGGHIGLFRCLLDHLCAMFPYVEKLPPTLSIVMRYYYGPMFDSWIAPRFFQLWQSVPPDLDRAIHDVLRCVILDEAIPISKHVTSSSESSPSSVAASSMFDLSQSALRTLLRVPVLVDVNGYAQFASDLHRRYYLCQMYPSAVAPHDFQCDIDEWILQVLRTFEPDRLKNLNSAGADGFPKEGMLQHQFWRGACLCLPLEYPIAAEVSRIAEHDRAITGEVDFWINSKLQWAVELLRQGSDKGEHLGRFEGSGAYKYLQPAHWRVVDFRSAGASPRREDKYIAVVMNESYQRARVIMGLHRTEEVEFMGKYISPRQSV